MIVRPERTSDRDAIFGVHSAAFPTPAEANLVNVLREAVEPIVSLVADAEGDLVGHILFTPVKLSGQDRLRLMGLAPMAVTPTRQGCGTGSALVTAGIAACRESGVNGLVVLGHPGYYPRFGFTAASRFGIDSEYDVPDDVFMAMELIAGVFKNRTGRIS